jgi:hypothetical protein
MVDMPPQTVEPFVDLLNRPDGRFARVGYRPAGFGETLVSIELPIQLLEQAVACGLDLTTRITPSGEVVSDIRGWSENALTDLRLATSIDILISQVVSPGNLRLEEASLAELNNLLKSLELSIEQVKAALRRTSVEEV